jgi:hypothetical protein
MNSASPKLPFEIGAPSMVYGEDLLKNARTLADVVDNVEIVLFHTPSLHNIPSIFLAHWNSHLERKKSVRNPFSSPLIALTE